MLENEVHENSNFFPLIKMDGLWTSKLGSDWSSIDFMYERFTMIQDFNVVHVIIVKGKLQMNITNN